MKTLGKGKQNMIQGKSGSLSNEHQVSLRVWEIHAQIINSNERQGINLDSILSVKDASEQ